MKTCVELLFAHERQPVLGLSWLDSATLLTCGGDNKAKKWDLRMPEMNGQVSEAFLGHIAPVIFLPDLFLSFFSSKRLHDFCFRP